MPSGGELGFLEQKTTVSTPLDAILAHTRGMRLTLKRGAWVVAVALVVYAGASTWPLIHSYGIEGPGFYIVGVLPYAFAGAMVLLVVGAVLWRRSSRVSTALAVAASAAVGIAMVLDLTGISWIVDLLG